MKLLKSILLIAFILSTAQIVSASDEEELKKNGASKIQKKDGKIIYIRTECKDWTKAEFQLIGKQHHLKMLSLNGTTLTDEMLPLLLGLKNLEILQLNQARISDEGFQMIPKFPKLRALALYHHARKMKEFDGSGLKHLTNIKSLTFAGATTGDVAMQAIGALTQLESYSQWHNNETAEGMQQLLKLKQLKELRIGQRLPGRTPESLKPSFDEATFDIISQLKKMESINILEARLSYNALSKLKELPELKRLNIRNTDVSQADIDRITKELPDVKVKWTPLTDKEKESLKKKLKI